MYYTDEVLKLLRTAYYSTEKPTCEPIDIAIHIRRGDVKKENGLRYTENSLYRELIQGLKCKYPSDRITIVSEGAYEDFKELELDESCYKLNQPVWEAFHSLVTAKVLVTARSSFSYAAAILNEQTIYYMEFWHAPLRHWLPAKSLLRA